VWNSNSKRITGEFPLAQRSPNLSHTNSPGAEGGRPAATRYCRAANTRHAPQGPSGPMGHPEPGAHPSQMAHLELLVARLLPPPPLPWDRKKGGKGPSPHPEVGGGRTDIGRTDCCAPIGYGTVGISVPEIGRPVRGGKGDCVPRLSSLRPSLPLLLPSLPPPPRRSARTKSGGGWVGAPGHVGAADGGPATPDAGEVVEPRGEPVDAVGRGAQLPPPQQVLPEVVARRGGREHERRGAGRAGPRDPGGGEGGGGTLRWRPSSQRLWNKKRESGHRIFCNRGLSKLGIRWGTGRVGVRVDFCVRFVLVCSTSILCPETVESKAPF